VCVYYENCKAHDLDYNFFENWRGLRLSPEKIDLYLNKNCFAIGSTVPTVKMINIDWFEK